MVAGRVAEVGKRGSNRNSRDQVGVPVWVIFPLSGLKGRNPSCSRRNSVGNDIVIGWFYWDVSHIPYTTFQVYNSLLCALSRVVQPSSQLLAEYFNHPQSKASTHFLLVTIVPVQSIQALILCVDLPVSIDLSILGMTTWHMFIKMEPDHMLPLYLACFT